MIPSTLARLSLLLAGTLLMLALAACGDDDTGNGSSELTVFAAASLTDAFGDIKAAFEEENPDVDITYNFAGSQALATQLLEGAGADVFASANNAQMTAAEEGGVISDDPQIFTRNRLVVIVPGDNPADLTEPADLATPGIKLVIAAEAVPVGTYSLEALDKMSADPTYGSDFRASVEANVVSLEDNVRQVVAKVALGEADAGIVYVTDTAGTDTVELIDIPDEFNVIAEYPIAAVEEGNTELAEAFIAYILSDEGQATLQEYGFAELP